MSCETEAIKGHIESKNFTKLQTYEGQNMIETRQTLWDQTLQHAAGLFAEIELPEEMSKMLLQLIPHLQIRLSHMYVIWKIKAGATRACYKSGEAVEVNWDAIPDADMVACVGIVALNPRKWNKDVEEAWRKDLGNYDYGV